MGRGWLAVTVFATAVVAGCGGTATTTQSAPTPMATPTPPAKATTATASPKPAPTPTKAEQPVVVPAALKFSGTTLDGKAYDGAKLAGKPTALWFWAPWCHVCRDEAPTVKHLAAEHKSTVNVVGVAGLGERQAMREFVDDNDLANVTQLADEQGTVWKRFDVTSQASWVLLDANGEEVFRGRLDHDELEERVGALAKQ